MVQAFFSLDMAVYTLGEYNWRHRGDFLISTQNTLRFCKITLRGPQIILTIFSLILIIWGCSRWKFKNCHCGATCIHLRYILPQQVRNLLEPHKLWGVMLKLWVPPPLLLGSYLQRCLYDWHFLVHFMSAKRERFICNSWSMVFFQLILDTQVFAKRLGIKANAT